MNEKYAYVTTLTSKNYVPGVLALKKSLKRTKTKYKLYVLIPKNNAATLLPLLEKILDTFCLCIVLDDINQNNISNHYWDLTFFKLQAASLIQFDKVVLLDSDMLINKNIDHLFMCESFSAVVAGKSSHNEYVDLNSGLLVLEPNLCMFEELINLCQNVIKARNSKNLFAGDQDVFIAYKTNWRSETQLHLSEKYNCFFNDIYRVSSALSCKPLELSVIHFIGSEKPWMNKRSKRYMIWLLKRRRFAQLFFYHKYLQYSRHR